MQNLVVYGVSALFMLSLVPVYTSVYLYADGGRRYVSASVYLWRIFRPLQLSTADDGRMQMNGREFELDPAEALRAVKEVLDNLCLFKLVQLCDIGMQSGYGAYLALFQRMIVLPLYKYIELSGSACKLKNYTVLDDCHDGVIWCGKAVCVFNIVAAVKILICILRGNSNED